MQLLTGTRCSIRPRTLPTLKLMGCAFGPKVDFAATSRHMRTRRRSDSSWSGISEDADHEKAREEQQAHAHATAGAAGEGGGDGGGEGGGEGGVCTSLLLHGPSRLLLALFLVLTLARAGLEEDRTVLIYFTF